MEHDPSSKQAGSHFFFLREKLTGFSEPIYFKLPNNIFTVKASNFPKF